MLVFLKSDNERKKVRNVIFFLFKLIVKVIVTQINYVYITYTHTYTHNIEMQI